MLDETPLAPLGPAGLVFMASGQGSQKPGMGADLLDIPEVANVFECASDVLGRRRGSAGARRVARRTERHAQRPDRLRRCRSAWGRALEARGIVPGRAAPGFSLGQISAMLLGGMLAEEDVFALIAERSRLMGEAADANPGVMSALLKITLPEAEALCAQCAEDEVLVPANLNGGGQIVIAGTPAAVTRAMRRRGPRARAASRAWPRPVPSTARLMAPGAGAFRRLPGEGGVPASRWCRHRHVHAAPLDVAGAREELVAHLVSPCSSRPAWQSFRRSARRCSRKWASAACSPIS